MDETRSNEPPPRPPDALQELLSGFLTFIRIEKGQSPLTSKTYERQLGSLMVFLRKLGRKSWEEAGVEDLQEWISSLKKFGYHVHTLHQAVAAARAFFKFASAEHQIEDLSRNLELPRRWESLPHSLTVEEMDLILKAPRLDEPIGVRDRAILELFYASGLRLAELPLLQVQDIQWELGVARVFGKGNKTRIVPVGKQALLWIRRYLNEIRPQWENERTGGELFLSIRGTRISRETVARTVRIMARRAGIQKRVTPHMIRHSFATHLLAGGADLRAIQEMLGHSNIDTTQIYTFVDQSQLSKTYRNFHPRA
jgi:integrase/recombinase XerD